MEKEFEQKQEMYRHSMSHVLAKAIKELYGENVKLAIGPAIDNGFYYDFDNLNIKQEDFDKIESKMREIIERNEDFVRMEVSREQALEMFKDEPYKTELINELPEDSIISVYKTGDNFMDLCRGPHVENTKFLRGFSFKINRASGAYWKGSEKNKMLTRIYVYGFINKDDLKECLRIEAEAKERDHRKLGKDLGIFMFNELVGKGLPMWLPKGYALRRELNDYIINKEIALGYQHVMTPSLGNINLYKTSGHWEHYQDSMFPEMKVEDESYVLRPMNCPHHMVMFKNFQHSYRDLPVRIAEIANDFRYEASGTLVGIERTRAFTQNDSHIFCRPDQIKQEVEGVIKLILDVYKDFGFDKFKFRLSLRDKNNTEKYFGNDDLWEKSETALREILKDSGADYYEAEGEAAFYGPKIDVQVISAIGHEITLSTVQAIIPQIVIIISKNKIDYYSFFSSSYWVLIVLVAVLVGIALTVFFLKKNFLGHQIALSIPLFIVYIMVVTLISTFASFYSVELALGVSLCQLIAFASMLLLDLIKQMRDKYHIKLMIEYVIILIGFIVYCCVVKKQIVGCFIYLTFLMLFCTYMIFEFRHMLFEFVNTFKLSCEKEISIMVYAVAMMNSNVDILMCCFK